ncbi:DUF2382 domain-containing protein [Cellulomonas sp. 179-A 4D5 NHS]|uniref:DUF2382 domain-containing protein n=1 Tax=Cellulomonas sp. 179-A 4D5 NHS TaxID=3142378 RepID=UPI0039A1D581
MLTKDQIDTLTDATAVDINGDKVGKVGQVYLDDATGQPDWVSVHTGLFGTSESLVPLQSASVEGDVLRLAYTKDHVKDAPNVDADRHLSEDDEARLFDHYGLTSNADYAGTDTYAAGTGTYAEGTVTDTDAARDSAMTRSEEQLHVGTERREAGRARLRKYVVTEEQTVTVPVSHEEVRVVHEPITDANIDDALSGPDLTEAEHEVVLTEERPVVAKETVPVERIKLETETVTEQATVTEDVRKERIDTEGVDDDRL